MTKDPGGSIWPLWLAALALTGAIVMAMSVKGSPAGTGSSSINCASLVWSPTNGKTLALKCNDTPMVAHD